MTNAPLLDAVLRGIARNRTPGWNFPGHFLALSFDEVTRGRGRVSLEPGPHCTDGDGRVNVAALSVLADIGMAASIRSEVGFASRMATVTMALAFTGAPARGRVEMHSELEGYVDDVAGTQGLVRGRMLADGVIVASGTGSFISLPGDVALAPLPARPRSEQPVVEAPDPASLEGEERAIYERAVAAAAPGPGTFLDRFWGLLPQRVEGGADCVFDNALHVGNRVGHTQGGLTFALSAATAIAALEADWRFVGISAWYVSPGVGPKLTARARIVHAGKLTAVVQTTLTTETGRIVMEAITNHTRAKR